MEKSAADSTVVLSVNINCCEPCARKVKKLLLKVTGVVSVDVDRKKRLVRVTGKADTKLLIKAIGKMKKKADIVAIETTSKNEANANQNAKIGEDSPTPPPPPPHTTAGPTTAATTAAATNGFNEGVCRNQHCRVHRRNEMDYFPEYRAMPHAGFYPSPPWMRYRQDEYGYPPMIQQGYGVNYPGHLMQDEHGYLQMAQQGYGVNYPGQYRPWI